MAEEEKKQEETKKEETKKETEKPKIEAKKEEKAKKEIEKDKKIVLEREYIVPLRSEWLKVPEYKRANKAVKALKQFIAQHMKIYDRDLRRIKIDIYLNNEIRFRGMRKPPAKIKVRAIKYDNNIVEVKLVNIPKHIEFEMARKVRQMAERMKKPEARKEEKKEKLDEKITEEKKEEAKEKEKASKEAMQNTEKQHAKQIQHTSKTSQEVPKIQRKALKK